MEIIIETKTPRYLTVDDIAQIAQVSRTLAYEIAHDVGITRFARNTIRVEMEAFERYMALRTSTPKRRRKSIGKIQRMAETLAEELKELNNEK